MRKVVLYLQSSLDGVVSGVKNWGDINNEILEHAIAYYSENDTILFGSHSYPGMAEYWQKAEKESTSSQEKQLAKLINEKEKFVLSHHPVELSWRNSSLLQFQNEEDLRQKINDLKSKSGKNISVESVITIWQTFFRLSLFDELMIFSNP